jgi:uncharacterized repeat protein (TIGR03806 family)
MRRPTILAALASSCVCAAVLIELSGSRSPAADAGHPVPPPLKQAPPTQFECRWTDAPIQVDGAGSDPAWKQAEPIAAFHLPWLGNQARMARTAATAKLLWDREYLYFFAELEDSDLFADITKHNGDLWKNDVFELFFRPDAAKTGYYEFLVNAAGATFEAFYPKYGANAKEGEGGAFHLEAKVKLRGTLNKRDDVDQGWSVEGRIPWTDFVRTGGRPTPGEEWKLNLCRYDYHKDWKEPELSCIAPIAQKKLAAFFHQSDDYARVKFVGPDAATARPFGIEAYTPLTTSTVAGFPDPPPPYRVVRTLPEYKPEYPIALKRIPGSDEALVITQPWSYGPTALSLLKLQPLAKEASLLFKTPDEGTAYEIAFHPKFAENGFFYVGWNGASPGQKGKHSKITRYTMTTKPPFTVDPKSATLIIEWPSDGHNGAAVCFGDNGLMYVTSGDGTSDSDNNVTGQRPDLLLAKVLRIDVDHPAPGKEYSVPSDNPYVNDSRFAPETWAYGLRNPWRISFDAATKQLWVGNNGQDLWEQAYLVRKGENYGWSVMEGSHPFYESRKPGPTPFVKPTVEHHHSEGRSLTGGFVYHGSKFPELRDAYIYGDYSTGRIWAVKHDGKAIVWHKEIAISTLKITGFAPDVHGEILICHHSGRGDGGLFTLEPNPEKASGTFPRRLSESGLFESVKTHTMKPGVIPYSVNAPFWSDGLYKERFLALPAGEKIPFSARGGWNLPEKTVIVKSFAIEDHERDPSSRKWIETRFLTKQAGEWYGYSYVWNEAGTDATLVDAKGMDRDFTIRTAAGLRLQTWHYPSRAECMVCHSRAANFVLGVCELQLNKDHAYPGGQTDNQLRVLEHLGLLEVNWYGAVRDEIKDAANKPLPDQRQPHPSALLPHPPSELKRLVNPYDKSQDLTLRARSWLHTNCSMCHVEAGGGNAKMELDFATALDKMRLIDEKPVHTTFDLPDAKLIAPGAPERSVVLHRIGLRAAGQMPPLASTRIDEEGLALMREWVKALRPQHREP